MDTGIHRWEILFPSENYSNQLKYTHTHYIYIYLVALIKENKTKTC